MISTIIECGSISTELNVWAQYWCETAARAGFLSTLIEGLSTLSIAAPVSKNSSKLVYHILHGLEYVGRDHLHSFDMLASGGSMQGFIHRVMDSLGKKDWAEGGVFAVSAILAGKNLLFYRTAIN